MSSSKDLTGSIIGNFELLERKREDKRTYYYCKCLLCNNKKWIRADSLKDNRIKSCGCYNQENNFYKAKDIKNKRFGRLIATKPTIKRDKDNGCVIWECKCDCNNITYVSESDLNKEVVKSCGCLGKENSRNNMQKAIKVHLKKNIVEGTNVPVISRKTLKSNNTSGVTGVRWDKSRNKWYAEITFKKKVYYLGRHEKKQDAIKIRKKAEVELFGEFLEWYNRSIKGLE